MPRLNRAQTLVRVAAEFEGWAPALTRLLTETETDPLLRPIYGLPIEHRWERVAGATLIGDAANLMSPFAGEGANLAMFNGAELAKALVGRPGDVEGRLELLRKRCFCGVRKLLRRRRGT